MMGIEDDVFGPQKDRERTAVANPVDCMVSRGVWPDLIAPPRYENPDPRWEDPKLPDIKLIWKLARQCGYAVGVHGSLKRDFDLIAAPWTEGACGNAALVDHMCAGLNAKQIGGPDHKPQGRVAVTLQIDGYFKPIDLSIMPII
jgi:hypothetical protein